MSTGRSISRRYLDADCEEKSAESPRAFTLKDQVKERIETLHKRVSEQEELQKLLEAHPEIERALTLLGNT